MNILAIGDVVGSIGCEFLRSRLPALKKEKNIDLVIANGENSADGNGITPFSMRHLFSSGVDVITTGNHAFRRKEIFEAFDDNDFLIRPANYPAETTPGKGFCVIDLGRTRVCVINLMGVVYLNPLDCPFKTIDEILSQVEDVPVKIVDFHAEATAEKRALGFYLNGKVSAIFGTHTHVQTADATILSKRTAYITDLGMTGPINSVIGVKPEISIAKMKNKLPIRFVNATGRCKMDCVLFNVDESTGSALSAERLQVK